MSITPLNVKNSSDHQTNVRSLLFEKSVGPLRGIPNFVGVGIKVLQLLEQLALTAIRDIPGGHPDLVAIGNENTCRNVAPYLEYITGTVSAAKPAGGEVFTVTARLVRQRVAIDTLLRGALHPLVSELTPIL